MMIHVRRLCGRGVIMEVVTLHVVQEQTRQYTVTTPAQHGGAECPSNHGAKLDQL